jgi:hypothetical protein
VFSSLINQVNVSLPPLAVDNTTRQNVVGKQQNNGVIEASPLNDKKTDKSHPVKK